MITQEFYDKRLDFTYQDQDYIWFGDYKVINTDSKVEVKILYTDFCAYYRDFSDVLLQVTPSNGLLSQINIELQKNIKF